MKSFLPALCCLFVVNLAVRSSAQSPTPPARPPGSAQRSADGEKRNPALADVLADYGRLIGKRIVMDVTVSPNTPLTLPDLDGVTPPLRTSLIERTLFLNNYALVDADKDTVEILGPGKNPRASGMPLYTKPEELPSGERVFSYLFKLEHRDAIEVTAFLQQFIPPGNAVNFTADVKSHSLIATAQTSVMRTVIRVVAVMDAVDGAPKP